MAENPEDLIVTDAELRRQLPALAKELKIGGGSGIEQVSGTVVLDASGDPIREFFTTGATAFKANGVNTPIGAYTAVVWRRDGSGRWTYAVVDIWKDTALPVPDTTAPTAGTLSVSDVTDAKATLTVSGASDNQALASAPYRFSVDNGATWTAWQSSPTYTANSLTAAKGYTALAEVKDAAGNTSRTTAQAFTTNALPPAVLKVALTDTFTGADGPFSSVHTTTDTGQAWAGSTGSSRIASNRAAPDAANTPVYVNHGATAREVTVDAYFPTAAGVFLLWAWHGGAAGDLSSPRAYVAQNGQVTLNNITQTYNASGGNGGVTPVGYLTLAAGTVHAVKVTYDGTRVTLYVNGTRIIEGTPTTALTGTWTALARADASAAHADNLAVKVVA